MNRTIICERFLPWCARGHVIRLTYMGVQRGPEPTNAADARNISRNMGFTHIRFTGEWPGQKPRGGRLNTEGQA